MGRETVEYGMGLSERRGGGRVRHGEEDGDGTEASIRGGAKDGVTDWATDGLWDEDGDGLRDEDGEGQGWGRTK